MIVSLSLSNAWASSNYSMAWTSSKHIKVNCKTYLERIMQKHLDSRMRTHEMPDRPTLLPTKQGFMDSFLSVVGDSDPKVQVDLAKEMKFTHRSSIGKIIYAMITCRPDMSFLVTSSKHRTTSKSIARLTWSASCRNTWTTGCGHMTCQTDQPRCLPSKDSWIRSFQLLETAIPKFRRTWQRR